MFSILIYIAAVIAANYTATVFIPFPVFGAVSVGTMIFGVTFTQRDRVHRMGRKVVYGMIVAAAILNAALSLFGEIPARIIIASFVSIVLAETADTEVYQKYLADRWMFRVLKSNAVSIPLDSLLFNIIAFWGVFPALQVAGLVFGEIVTKSIVSVLVAVNLKKKKESAAASA